MYRILHATTRAPANVVHLPDLRFRARAVDAIERITHSICTLEFEDHRPLYDWFIDELPVPPAPHQIEFARLNLTYTIMASGTAAAGDRGPRQRLGRSPHADHVRGAPPRLPAAALRDFCGVIGVAQVESTVDVAMLEYCVREDLNTTAPRGWRCCAR